MQALRLELAGLDGDPRLGPPLCVVLEGWDASGKGGAIKRSSPSSTRATCA
jgi:polyphosphate kinase 2 (PPK2 family)